MPLAYDDIPGSWGHYSQTWPSYECATEAEADRVYVACSKERLVPYGSYVRVDNAIRVETAELLEALTEHMKRTTVSDAREIIRMYESIELPLHCYDTPGVDMSMYLRPSAWKKLQRLRCESGSTKL